jgi:hypothetical protein
MCMDIKTAAVEHLPRKGPIAIRSSTGFHFELVSELTEATPAQKCRRTAALRDRSDDSQIFRAGCHGLNPFGGLPRD